MDSIMPGFNIPPFNSAETCDTDSFKNQSAYFGPSSTVETARKHRYRLEILEPFGSNNDGILLFCEKCTRPSPELDEIVIHNAQDEIYRPGKQKWNPIEFTFYEKLREESGNSSVDDVAERIYRWWGETMVDLTRSIHNPITNYYKNAHLQMLDGVGRPVWTYFLYECWPHKISPSDLSYSDSDIATISVTLRYNKARESKE